MFGVKPCGDTIVLRMNRKSKLSGIIERIKVSHKVRIEGISVGFKIIVAIALSYVLANVIASVFNLSASIRFILIAGLSVIVSLTVSIKPRLLLTVVCVMLSFIGFLFIVISLNKENLSQIGWDPSLLGAGTSILALAIAVYAFLIYTERKEGVINISPSRRGMSDLEGGYVWIEEIKKYRCIFCLNVGTYYYCKTLGGIKRHIASKHL